MLYLVNIRGRHRRPRSSVHAATATQRCRTFSTAMGRNRDGSFRLALGVLVAMQAPPCQSWADASVLAPGGSNEATVAALELGDYDNVTSRATRESSAIKLDLPLQSCIASKLSAFPLASSVVVVTLNPAVSAKGVSVASVRQSSIPAAATWLKLRTLIPPAPYPSRTDEENWPCGDKCWFVKTKPKDKSHFQGPLGIQQLRFTGMANLTLIVEAWSDRNDLGDGAKATLLATSPRLAYTFDDKGFAEVRHMHRLVQYLPVRLSSFRRQVTAESLSCACLALAGLLWQVASFGNFTAVETSIGSVTITAHATDPTWYAKAKLIAWYGFAPVAGSGTGTSLPGFTLDSTLLVSTVLHCRASGSMRWGRGGAL